MTLTHVKHHRVIQFFIQVNRRAHASPRHTHNTYKHTFLQHLVSKAFIIIILLLYTTGVILFTRDKGFSISLLFRVSFRILTINFSFSLLQSGSHLFTRVWTTRYTAEHWMHTVFFFVISCKIVTPLLYYYTEEHRRVDRRCLQTIHNGMPGVLSHVHNILLLLLYCTDSGRYLRSTKM